MITLALLAVAAVGAPVEVGWNPITFTSQAGEGMPAEEGFLRVPERRGQDGPTVRLALVRFRAERPSARPPLLYLAGGPGNSGILRARQELFPVFQALRAERDVIVFDQRGTGASEPSLAIEGAARLPSHQPLASPQVLELLALTARRAAAALRSAASTCRPTTRRRTRATSRTYGARSASPSSRSGATATARIWAWP